MASSAEVYLERIWQRLTGADGGSVPTAGGGGSTPSTANEPSISNGATAVVANTSRRAWAIQNLGTNVLYVKMGTGASTSSFHVALKAGTANDDGTGGFFSDESYNGIVTISGTSPRYTTAEVT